MNSMSLACSLWLAAQSGSAANAVREELLRLSRDNEVLQGRIEHMQAGLPDGVTKEEWDIIKELRKATP